MIKKVLPIWILALSTLFCSCDKEEPNVYVPDTTKISREVKEMMTSIYYWADDVDASIPLVKEDEIFDYFDDLLVDIDRWSWMMTGEQYLNSEAGISYSYGMQIMQPIEGYDDYSLKVAYVYPNSPMGAAGVMRGWTLTHIGGVSVEELIKSDTYYTVMSKPNNDFTFIDEQGVVVEYNINAEEIHTRSVLTSKVFTPEDFPALKGNVGYMNYLTFNANMMSDLDDAVNLFKANNVSDVILDLRYNGGGDMRASEYLANLLAPASAEGAVLSKQQHNSKYASMDAGSECYIKRAENALNLNRLFIISGHGTASASEIMINGLNPHMEVIQVGTQSYGKPNGMYVLPYPEDDYESPDYIFLPICFFTVNSEGEGFYVDGIAPTYYEPDDLYHDFTAQEATINDCLQYIATGSFPPPAFTQQSALSPRATNSDMTLARPYDAPNYGSYKVYK